LTADEKVIYDALKIWRQAKAVQLNMPSYMVCHNAHLMTLAKVKPQSLEAFAQIKGFGARKISQFGEDLVAVLNAF